MDTEKMIRELRAEAEKHKDDQVFTGQTNISNMCRDVADRLEEQEYLINNLCSTELSDIYKMQFSDGWVAMIERSAIVGSDGMYWIEYDNDDAGGISRPSLLMCERKGTLFFTEFKTGNCTKIAVGHPESVLRRMAFNNAFSRYKNRLLEQFHDEKQN